MYVATVGPAEAYLIRQARLSTLPDPHRERGLPSGDIEPDVWRGEISVGDSLVLVSPNVVAKLGPDELKDAMLTLHPQSAMEHLHHRFVADGGAGSDGAIAFEAAEVSATARGRSPVPVKPPEPLAGAPDRSPIPLADNVQAAGLAVSAAAGSAKVAAGGAFGRVVQRVQDLMPRRKPAYRRVTPLASRRETQRRAALALLALVVVVGGLGLAVYAFGGTGKTGAIASVNQGQAALDKARENLAKVKGPGIDLVAADPGQAKTLLTEAYQQLDAAEKANVSAAVVDPLRAQAVAGLDALYGVVPVASTTLFTFKPAAGAAPIDLGGLVKGPDGAPYVLDRSTKTVYRIDLKNKKATLVARAGTKAGGTTVATPKFLAVGGQDVLILDSKNVLWRWRSSNATGKGTLVKVTVQGSSSWGDDVTAIGTYLQDASRGLYKLYVVDPSEQQIHAYSPAADGGGFPAKPPALARHRAGRQRHHLAADRRRPLCDRERAPREVHVGQGQRLEGQAARRRPAPPRPDLHALVGAEPAGRSRQGRDLRLRRAERPDRRHREGQQQLQRRVQGAVPAGRPRPGLGGPPRHGRDAGRGRRAGERAVDLGRRAPPGVARGRPGRGRPARRPARPPRRRRARRPPRSPSRRRSRPRSRRAAGP